jgi:ATP-dependent Lhr-like helicase
MPLAPFHPVIAGWFRGRFGAPTEVQAKSWPAIAAGSPVLIAAPTGSGKTLAASKAPVRTLVEAAKLAAQRQLAETPLHAIKPNDFRAAETRAAKRGAAAARAGDYPAAEREKRRQLFYHQLTAEGLKVLREMERAQRDGVPIQSGSYQRAGEHREGQSDQRLIALPRRD